jgi:hypothetical protein
LTAGKRLPRQHLSVELVVMMMIMVVVVVVLVVVFSRVVGGHASRWIWNFRIRHHKSL